MVSFPTLSCPRLCNKMVFSASSRTLGRLNNKSNKADTFRVVSIVMYTLDIVRKNHSSTRNTHNTQANKFQACDKQTMYDALSLEWRNNNKSTKWTVSRGEKLFVQQYRRRDGDHFRLWWLSTFFFYFFFHSWFHVHLHQSHSPFKIPTGSPNFLTVIFLFPLSIFWRKP